MVNSPQTEAPAQSLRQLNISRRQVVGCLGTLSLLTLGALFFVWLFYLSGRAEARTMLAYEVKLNDQDEWIDWKSANPNEPRLHCNLKLSNATYQSFFAKVSVQGKPLSRDSHYRWPWPVPADAIQLERVGSVYAFSPGTRIVFVGIWND